MREQEGREVGKERGRKEGRREGGRGLVHFWVIHTCAMS